MSTTQQNHYAILRVDRTATQSDIKRAYRQLAKKYHPDTNRCEPKAAAQRFKQVIDAYRVLGNERERALYDVLLQTSPSFSEATGAPRPDTLKGRARSILDDLLHGHGRRALATFDQLNPKSTASIEPYMDARDYLDCVFLLAEQLERVGRNSEAVELYEELYEREKEPPRVRHFFPEVKVRLKKLYSRKLPREAKAPEDEIACYERMLEFDVDRSEKAFILKKIAEVYLKVGQTPKARKMFEEALVLKPGLKGTATIRERLGVE